MFRKDTYQFNSGPNFDFQFNLIVMWGNGDPDEIQKGSEAAARGDGRNVQARSCGRIQQALPENDGKE